VVGPGPEKGETVEGFMTILVDVTRSCNREPPFGDKFTTENGRVGTNRKKLSRHFVTGHDSCKARDSATGSLIAK
jgi:hypothetical protein